MKTPSLTEKYTCEADKTKPGESGKIVLSNDAYAVCTFIQGLMNQVTALRRNL